MRFIRLNEMSFNKNEVIKKLNEQSKPFIEHFFKLYFYKGNNSYTQYINSWINTLSNILNIVNNLTMKKNIKPSAKLLDTEFYFNYISEFKDLEVILSELFLNGFNEFNYSDYILIKAFKKYQNMCLDLNNILTIHNKLTKNDFTEFIKDILNIH